MASLLRIITSVVTQLSLIITSNITLLLSIITKSLLPIITRSIIDLGNLEMIIQLFLRYITIFYVISHGISFQKKPLGGFKQPCIEIFLNKMVHSMLFQYGI